MGIPSRPVTNFYSGQDFNEDLKIRRKYDKNGKGSWIDDESIWNFHVWTEVWLARNDLKVSTYDGWQVIDATPQEKSEGISMIL